MTNTNPKTSSISVAVGLSGGVDSAVTALLLKQQGYQVSAIFMQNWAVDREDPYCTAEQDLSDARTVCDQLDIPLHVISFAEEYWQNVFQYCLDEFARGRTPNPDIWCNREIKFKALLNQAQQLGADYLATGHYARIQHDDSGLYHLIKGIDRNKDQSYFLYTLGQFPLTHSLFPLGGYEKTEVRALAKQHNLINSAKKDSTGICFIGERKFKEFLKGFLLAQPGNMETPDGSIIGQHDGVMFYTLGQRQGLAIGGKQGQQQAPWYVLAKDVQRNVLVVGQGHDHPLLYASTLLATDCHWTAGHPPGSTFQCHAKARYRQADQACTVQINAQQQAEVTFSTPQRALTPGQAIVFYQQDECLGGATIDVCH